MQDAKEEVRARLNIEDVIGEYVQLKRAGRSFKGLSPFSGEKTPSFYVSPDKQIWHDFSSNKGGDVFSFVMEVEGLDFRQALEMLARKAGVDMSQYNSRRSGEIAKKKQKLLEANKLAAHYFQRSMLENKHALDYIFKKRGLNKQTVSDFQIGYAPDNGRALVQVLRNRGFSAQDLAEAGLTNRFGGDMFRGRMTVPLMDPSGQVIGFTARILADIPDAPKYLNTSQTLIYDKGRHVFGLSQAKEAIRKSGYVVIVEGNMDVVSSHQAGVKQVVATAGTAMTEHHLSALKRLTNDMRLAFDGDKAGIAATERAISIASNLGVELTIISLPEGAKDPDELIQKDVAAWQEAIDQAEPAVDWILNQYAARVDLATASGKRTFTSAALAVVRGLADAVEREHYENKVAEMTQSTLKAVHTKLTQISESARAEQQKTQKRVVDSAKTIRKDDYAYQDNALALALLDKPSREQLKDLNADYFNGPERAGVASFLQNNLDANINDTPEDLKDFDTYVKILLLKADSRYAEWEERERFFEMARLVRQVETEHKKQKLQDLTDKLRRAEDSDDESSAEALRAEINQLIKEIARAKR